MDGQRRLKAVFERNKKALSLRPAIGQKTVVSKVRVREDYICDIEDGKWRLIADMGEKSGGRGAGPDPGVLGRATLGSCLAIGYVMWAANLSLPITGIEVEVHADMDAQGRYGLADVPMGYKEIRYVVKVESDAPEEDVMRVLDEADAHSPYLEVFSQPMRVQREVRISGPAGQRS